LNLSVIAQEERRMMNALRRYDSAIWVRVAGTFLTKVAQFIKNRKENSLFKRVEGII